MNLLDLMVKVGVEDNASTAVTNLASNLGSKLKVAAAVGTAAIAAVGAAAAAVTSKMYDGVKATASYGDNVDKMSQKIGISAESYQKWSYVMERAGTSVDNLQAGMKTLSTQAQANSEDFQKLGISQEEVATLSQEDLFEKTIAGLSSMEEGTERTALATSLLGKSATELGPLLNEGTEEIEKQMEMAERYGLVMSDSAVKASAEFTDSLTTLSGTVKGLQYRFYSEFLPSITDITDGLALMFVGDTEEGLEKFREGVEGIAEKMREVLPNVLEVGGQIAGAIASGFVENLPTIAVGIAEGLTTLTTSLGELLTQASVYIASNSPAIVDAFITLLTGFGSAVIAALPSILAALGSLIAVLVVRVCQAAGDFITAGGEAIGGVVTGILHAATDAANAVGEVMQGAVDKVGEFINDAFHWGEDIVKSIADGITNAISFVTGPVTSLADTIASFLHFSEPDVGPLSDFHTYMPDMIDLMVEGIEKGRSRVSKAVGNLASDISGGVSVTASAGSASSFGNVGVYLDGTKLVGYLLPDIDTGLGRLQVRSAR